MPFKEVASMLRVILIGGVLVIAAIIIVLVMSCCSVSKFRVYEMEHAVTVINEGLDDAQFFKQLGEYIYGNFIDVNYPDFEIEVFRLKNDKIWGAVIWLKK